MHSLDERLLRFARTRGHGDRRVERAVAGFSRLGEHGGVWLAIGAIGYALDRPRAARWGRALGIVAGTYALNTGVKLAVRRRRPELPGLPPLTSTPTRLSFPSAHASTSFAAAGLYSQLGLSARGLYALAAGLSASRLYLGVHYPSDVIAGAALGVTVARCSAHVGGAARTGKADVAGGIDGGIDRNSDAAADDGGAEDESQEADIA